MRKRRYLYTGVALLFLILLIAYSLLRRPSPPNIILVSIDALRASELGCYGYSQNTSPRIDQFSRESTLFEHAFSQEPWTLTSHMAMLTSHYPPALGVGERTSLSPRIATLPELLRKKGYRAAGFATNPGHMNAKYGFDRGFDIYRTGWWNAGELNRRVFKWLRKKAKPPFFLFVHYFDVHSDRGKLPYEVPRPYRGRYAPPEVTFRGKEKFDSKTMKEMHFAGEKLTPQELKNLQALYDEGVAYADHEVGRLLAELRDLGYWDDSLIILTADHGEEFQEHGGLIHFQIYNELLHVPLIIKFPRGAPFPRGRRAGEIAQLIDITPTVLDFIGFEAGSSLQGESLLATLRGEGRRSKFSFSTGSFRGSNAYSIQDLSWKLIYSPSSKESALFDVKHDPGEKRDVIASHPGVAARLKGKLLSWIGDMARVAEGTDQGKEAVAIGEENRERLRALGYVQ